MGGVISALAVFFTTAGYAISAAAISIGEAVGVLTATYAVSASAAGGITLIFTSTGYQLTTFGIALAATLGTTALIGGATGIGLAAASAVNVPTIADLSTNVVTLAEAAYNTQPLIESLTNSPNLLCLLDPFGNGCSGGGMSSSSRKRKMRVQTGPSGEQTMLSDAEESLLGPVRRSNKRSYGQVAQRRKVSVKTKRLRKSRNK